jgi:hypothetical protein
LEPSVLIQNYLEYLGPINDDEELRDFECDSRFKDFFDLCFETRESHCIIYLVVLGGDVSVRTKNSCWEGQETLHFFLGAVRSSRQYLNRIQCLERVPSVKGVLCTTVAPIRGTRKIIGRLCYATVAHWEAQLLT